MDRALIAVAVAVSIMAPLTVMVYAKGEGSRDALPSGSVSRAAGLEAWKRIEAVVTHPRCANCHVNAGGIPIWTPAGERKDRVHGMNIHGGISRIGAEAIACSTCHMTSTLPNDPAPAPPRAGIPWLPLNSFGTARAAPRFANSCEIRPVMAAATPSPCSIIFGTMHR